MLIFIFITTLIKFIIYLVVLIYIVEENKVGVDKYKSIRKSGNKIVKILAKLKSRNLPKCSFQSTYITKKSNSLTFYIRVVFTN